MFVEPGDKPETIKSAVTLGGGRIFTDTFIHFLRFTSDKSAEPISRDATKNSPMFKFKSRGGEQSFLFLFLFYQVCSSLFRFVK